MAGLGNVDRDNKLDVVVATYSNIVVFTGNGDGTLVQGPMSMGVWGAGARLVLEDLKLDGKLDLVTAHYSQQFNATFLDSYLGQGNGNFAAAVSLRSGSPYSMASGDLDLDGYLDVVSVITPNQVQVTLGNGDGTLQQPVLFQVGTSPLDVVVADVNKDGKPDVISANGFTKDVSVLINTSK